MILLNAVDESLGSVTELLAGALSIRSAHEASSASAWSAKSLIGVWYSVMAR